MITANSKSKVTLVGAGPGDPELLTLKGLKAIQQADAILYDSLVNEDILNFAKDSCKKLYVGKRFGCKSMGQDAINKILVDYAIKYNNVVRLKGGDPFVFGRGYEEAEYIRNHFIDVEIIQGISSCISVPASAGIPVTCRGVNESFWVTTGTLSSGELSSDIFLAARSSATVIVLMGLNKINEIAEIFIAQNKSSIPCAVIENGTMSEERIAIGTASDIAEKIKDNGIQSPAVIVFGEVVKLSGKYFMNSLKEMVSSL